MNTFQVYGFNGLEFIIVFVEMASILIDGNKSFTNNHLSSFWRTVISKLI